ncbi:hypothetical protein [Oceanobacillus timonensis]|uniref:hypothetical protein n=1 Tax=Oceanobacillus timonensis TaxID=1926285 RepID=UPI0009BB06C7|nr:hypothetical protein [Oceanobacillus timonensis]
MLNTVKENTNRYHAKNPDYDGLWKNLIEALFQEFMEFFAPDLSPEIDFERGVHFENLELFQFIRKYIIFPKLNFYPGIAMSSSKHQKLGDFTSCPTISHHRFVTSP